jgi:bicarbonate transport system ATP-binding protein
VEMARWGDVPFPRNWVEVLENTCAVGVFSTAARELGQAEISYSRSSIQLVDGTTFNAEDPIRYLNELAIKRDVTMAEIPLHTRRAVAV